VTKNIGTVWLLFKKGESDVITAFKPVTSEVVWQAKVLTLAA